jgi:hypothetical protein
METSNNLPTAAKVFGILNCVFGGLSLAVAPVNFVGLENNLNVYRDLGMGELLLSWLSISVYISPVLALVLLVLGVGLLLKKPWGHKGAIIFAIISIVVAIINFLLVIISFGQAAGGGDPKAIGGMIGGAIGGALGMIYPILTVFFLTREKVKSFYARYQ